MDGFIGEIRLMALSFVPQGWLACNGNVLLINSYQALFAVIGTKFGGDGKTTFAVPTLLARTVVGAGDNPADTFDPAFATFGGTNTVALTTATMPAHGHTLVGATLPQSIRVDTPQGNYLAQAVYIPTTGASENGTSYVAGTVTPTATLNPATVAAFPGTGGAHENRQPYLAMQYFICNDGVFPMRP